MKFWARQVVRLSDGPSWTRSLQRHHVCMCEHAYMCFSLSSSAPPKVMPFLCFPPPSVQRFPEYWPRSQKPVLAVSVLPVCSFFLAEWRCVLHVLLFEHAQLLVLFFGGRPWCQASLPVKTSWVVQNPRHLADAMGRWHHLLFSPQCYFVLNIIDTPGAFDVKIMKKWSRWLYSIFILAIWFSTNHFGEPSRERSGLFPGISQTLEDKLFSSLPITSAKKCWKSKWKIKTHEARNSFCDLCLDMVIYQKSSEVSFPLFFGKGSSWQLNIDFLVLV